MTPIDHLSQVAMLLSVAVLVIEAIVWFCFREDYLGKTSGHQKLIKLRLSGYSFLKHDAKGPILKRPYSQTLTPIEHEVLLGTLKKVEGKNAVLVTIIVFALSLTGGSLLGSGKFDSHDYFVSVFVLGLIWPLYMAFSGIRQLDQRDFRILDVKHDAEVAAINLQRDLLSDLMKKEFAFKFGTFCSKWLVLLFLFIVSLNAILVQQMNQAPISHSAEMANGASK